MPTVLGILSLVLLGAEPPRPAVAPTIGFQMQVIELQGVDWRAPVAERLEPVTRQGSATVWTAPLDVAEALASRGETISAPRLVAQAGEPAHINLSAALPGTNAVEWRAKLGLGRGPSGDPAVQRSHFEAAGPASATDPDRPRFAATFTGRKLDQGVLTQLVLEETRALAVHQVRTTGRKPRTLAVPEIARSEVAGEWLIPNDGALVLNLGVHTVANTEGKAEVRERLVVLTARPLDPAVTPAAVSILGRMNSSLGIARVPVLPAPIAPSRSLPQPRNADGEMVPLPPLPDECATPTSLPDSSEPCASPQTRPAPERSKSDADSRRTSFEAPPRPRAEGRPVVYRFPFNGATVEVRISTPDRARADDDCQCEDGCE